MHCYRSYKLKQKEKTDSLNCPSNSKTPPYARYPYDNLRLGSGFSFTY